MKTNKNRKERNIPNATSVVSVGEYWIDQIERLHYDSALEEYIDFTACGENVICEHDGKCHEITRKKLVVNRGF